MSRSAGSKSGAFQEVILADLTPNNKAKDSFWKPHHYPGKISFAPLTGRNRLRNLRLSSDSQFGLFGLEEIASVNEWDWLQPAYLRDQEGFGLPHSRLSLPACPPLPDLKGEDLYKAWSGTTPWARLPR